MADEPTLLTSAATPEAPAEAAAPEPVAPGAAQDASDWRPESLRGEKSLEKYNKPEDAFKALVEAQKLIGKRAEGIVPPGEGATPEQVDAFNAKLRELRGVPTEDKIAEAYAVVAPEDAPEGYALNPELVGAFQGLALEAGLAPAEFQKLAQGYMAMEVQAIAAARADAKARQQKAEDALVKEWRDAGEVPKEKLANALEAAKILGWITKTDNILGDLGNNTDVVKSLADIIWPLVKESGLKGGGHEQQGPTYTPQEARDKARSYTSDPRYKDPRKRDPDFVREADAFFEKHGKLISGR